MGAPGERISEGEYLNLGVGLHTQPRDRPCEVYANRMRVRS